MRGKIIVDAKGFFLGKILFSIVLFLFLMNQNLYAEGASEEVETETLYDTWILCITKFDTSGLSPDKQIIGNIVTRKMIGELSSLGARIRPPEEIAYYNEYAWSKARLEAGQTLKSKRDERDALLFLGDSSWTYKNKMKKIDEEIKTLEETFSQREADFPLVVENPAFSLLEQNLSGTYPELPETGMEYAFCKEQNIDGFLSGAISEYYGRIYLSIKLYTLYTQKYVYEDYELFSVEDQQTLLAELSGRLKSVLSGIEASQIVVKAKPENAIIVLNDDYAGRGNIEEKNQNPETVNIEVFAEDYQPEDFQVDLFSGELAQVSIELKPITYDAFYIDTSNGFPASLYLGSTYMGETPITLNLLPDQYEYITMENEKGESTSFIYDGSISTAHVTLSLAEENKKTVEDYRKGFYGAYGRFWLSLPIAFFVYGAATSAVNASNYSGTQGMYDNAVVTRNVSIGAAAIAGGFLIETLIRMGIYLYQSNSADVRKL